MAFLHFWNNPPIRVDIISSMTLSLGFRQLRVLYVTGLCGDHPLFCEVHLPRTLNSQVEPGARLIIERSIPVDMT